MSEYSDEYDDEGAEKGYRYRENVSLCVSLRYGKPSVGLFLLSIYTLQKYPFILLLDLSQLFAEQTGAGDAVVTFLTLLYQTD